MSQFGYYFIYSIQQKQIREEVKEQLIQHIPEYRLQQIAGTANKDNIKWEIPGKEFYLNGQLYDLAETRQVNGETIYYGLTDNKEEQLLKDLAKDIKSGTDNNTTKGGKNILKFHITDFIVTARDKITVSDIGPAQRTLFFDEATLSSFNEITAPPPRA